MSTELFSGVEIVRLARTIRWMAWRRQLFGQQRLQYSLFKSNLPSFEEYTLNCEWWFVFDACATAAPNLQCRHQQIELTRFRTRIIPPLFDLRSLWIFLLWKDTGRRFHLMFTISFAKGVSCSVKGKPLTFISFNWPISVTNWVYYFYYFQNNRKGLFL